GGTARAEPRPGRPDAARRFGRHPDRQQSFRLQNRHKIRHFCPIDGHHVRSGGTRRQPWTMRQGFCIAVLWNWIIIRIRKRFLIMQQGDVAR
ncbi:hypothetical protein, partial [Nguyenibacter vanlangensis]|uniref:hypothetical protein n=1 Tax=Nguyenibacter vanlangensis TaxID=1216886 RepID=UPI001C400951